MKVILLSNQGRSMTIFWRVLIESMRKKGMEVAACVPDGDDSPGELGIPVIHYGLERKGLNPFRDLQSLFQLREILLAEKPDIVFATTIKPVIYGCVAAHWAKVPHIFATITGLGYAFEADSLFKKALNRLAGFMYRISLRHASGIFFQNHEDAALFRQRGILDRDAPVFFARGTGVDTEKFATLPLPPAGGDGGIIFLMVARLLKAKGIHEYAEAARLLKQQYPGARFQLLGPPEAGHGSVSPDDLRAMAPAVEYLGQTSDVRPYIAGAHVAVLPSWREGTPTALMEAMSSGRPIVATDVPGCREVVENGGNGFLAEAKNPRSLAGAMRNFIEHPDLVAKMGQASRQLAVNRFDAHVVAEDILKNIGRSMQ